METSVTSGHAHHSSRWQRTCISIFVIVWLAVFHYESLRHRYLSPLVGYELPKLKFLFPPAGWIMFYNVDASYGSAEVYGIKNGQPALIDPHRIFATRFVWYDNIRRNVLIGVLSAPYGSAFCHYLRRKFPEYEEFAVVYAQRSDVVHAPDHVARKVIYRCTP